MILVTGGTGLLGSHLLFYLTQAGYVVKALKRTNANTSHVKKIFSYYSDDYEKLFEKINWIEGDITDYISVENALNNVDFVYHAAAQVSFNPEHKKILKQVNSLGTSNIVNAALVKGIKKLCYVSSIATLGRDSSEVSLDENSSWNRNNQNSVYARTKYEAEQEVWRGIAEGLNAVIVNPAIIIGPGKWDDGSAKLFDTVWNGQSFFTKGVNGYVDVRDVARIMIKLMDSSVVNERFILVSDHLSYEELFKKIAHGLNVPPPKYYAGYILSMLAWRFEYFRSCLFKHKPLITKETANTAHNKYYYNNNKIVKKLNYSFIPIEKTINDTAQIFLKEKKIK